MYALGHYGVALFVYRRSRPSASGRDPEAVHTPVGFLLARYDPTLALVGGAGVLLLSTVPDYDLRVPFFTHRGITHTLLFTLVVAGVAGIIGWQLGTGSYTPLGGPVESAAFLGGITLLGLGSHVLGDVLTPAGVAVLWPLSDREYTISLTRADNRIANWGLLMIGVVAATVALWIGGGLR